MHSNKNILSTCPAPVTQLYHTKMLTDHTSSTVEHRKKIQ